MPGNVGIIESMNDGNIAGAATEQPSLGLKSAGGGGRNTIFHKKERVELFNNFTSIHNLLNAWELFCKGKRSRDDVMLFERKLEDNLFELRDDLVSGRYRHSPYEPFTIHDPKQRTIHKAIVRDRVVHQAIVNIIEWEFEDRFIFDSFSCRRNKGTHAAVSRLQTFLRRASRNNTATKYALKCDVRKFFDSINHDVLLRLLAKRVQDKKLMALLKLIIESFSTSPGVGIPLGNLTSQLFANVYLHELDWYVKQTLGMKHYVRYCDDFVILTDSQDEAHVIAGKIDAFLRENLKLQLHPNKIHIRTWNQGIDFLGYILMPHATVLRPTTSKRMVKRVTSENAISYLGLCVHADAYELECVVRHKVS